LPLEVFTQRNVVADFVRLKLNFIEKQTQEIAFSCNIMCIANIGFTVV